MVQSGIDATSAVVRLVLAILIGGAIGFERGRHNQAAGLRTHILITLGSCLIMQIGVFLAAADPRVDPTRLAAQVVTGVGFLGAGAIFRYGLDIKGLTTAASIWAVSALGLAAGAGLYFLALAGTLMTLFVLVVLVPVSHKIAPHIGWYTLRVTGTGLIEREEELLALLRGFGLPPEKISLSASGASGPAAFSCHLTSGKAFDAAGLVARLTALPGVDSVSLDAVG